MIGKNDLIAVAAIVGLFVLAYVRELVLRVDARMAARRKALCAIHKARASSKKALELERRLERMHKPRLLK